VKNTIMFVASWVRSAPAHESRSAESNAPTCQGMVSFWPGFMKLGFGPISALLA
jgi:hypothetical protein